MLNSDGFICACLAGIAMAVLAVAFRLPLPLGPRPLHYVRGNAGGTDLPMVSLDEVLIKLFDGKKVSWGVSRETLRQDIVRICSDEEGASSDQHHELVVTANSHASIIRSLRNIKVLGPTAPSGRLMSHACLISLLQRRDVPQGITAVVCSVDPLRHGNPVTGSVTPSSSTHHHPATGSAAAQTSLSPSEVARLQKRKKAQGPDVDEAWAQASTKLKQLHHAKQQQLKIANTRTLSAPAAPKFSSIQKPPLGQLMKKPVRSDRVGQLNQSPPTLTSLVRSIAGKGGLDVGTSKHRPANFPSKAGRLPNFENVRGVDHLNRRPAAGGGGGGGGSMSQGRGTQHGDGGE